MSDSPVPVLGHSSEPSRGGRWGIRQLMNGEPTGGGTINLGWATRKDAEAANPPQGPYSYEVFERFAEEGVSNV